MPSAYFGPRRSAISRDSIRDPRPRAVGVPGITRLHRVAVREPLGGVDDARLLPVIQRREVPDLQRLVPAAADDPLPVGAGVFERSPLLSLASGARFFGCLAGHVVRGQQAVSLPQVGQGTRVFV